MAIDTLLPKKINKSEASYKSVTELNDALSIAEKWYANEPTTEELAYGQREQQHLFQKVSAIYGLPLRLLRYTETLLCQAIRTYSRILCRGQDRFTDIPLRSD